uniref:Uncharacterized protein n=1 Tax=Panagrolaimus sp. ES5 TaxID=591445 RepID=A0AC34FFJ4_9BILA
MVKVAESLINDIIKLGKSSTNKDQWDSSQLMCKNVFPGGKCVDPTAIPRLLPTIVKLMESKLPKTQEEGIFFATAITTTSHGPRTAKQNTQLIIDAEALPRLAKCLKTRSPGVLELALRCIGNIAVEFPEEVSATDGIEASVIRLCGSFTAVICEEAFNDLIALIYPNSQACRNILKLKALKKIKKSFMRKPNIVLLAIKFLKIVVSFEEEDFIDMIIEENFWFLILREIYMARDDNLKAKAAKVIKKIVSQKHEVIPQLIEEKIIVVIANILQAKNDKLVIHALTILQQIIDSIGYEEISERFKNNSGPQILQNLLIVHENEEIQELSNRINSFVVDDVKEPTVIAERRDIKRDASEEEEVEEIESEEPQQVAETPRSRRSAKRAATVQAAERPNTRSKRSKVSLEQTDTEPSGSVIDEDREIYNDFDDISSPPHSPVHPIVLELPTEMPSADAAAENNDAIPETPQTRNEENAVETPAANPARVIDEIQPVGTINDANLNANTFEPFKYYSPSEYFISKCCEDLGIQFIRKEYVEFLSKVDLDEITSNLKPNKFLPRKDNSGFSCFSIFFTGNEQSTEIIREKVNEYFVDHLDVLDKEKIKKVLLSQILLNEHLEVIVQMFKCKILVYCNGGWKKFGAWDIEEKGTYIPVFVIEKKENQNKVKYELVLSLKN